MARTKKSTEPQALPSLAEYIAARESADRVLVRVSYPSAQAHVFQGRYSGIVVDDGELSCQWSDGRTE
jgi:hypothetical protein